MLSVLADILHNRCGYDRTDNGDLKYLEGYILNKSPKLSMDIQL